MTSTLIDRLAGVSEGLAVKAPCRVATTGNITLAGLQTIDGVATADGDRVLVWVQDDAKENGIFNATSGNWMRAADFDGNRDIVRGTRVFVNEGDAYQNSEFIVTAEDPITLGVTDVVIELRPSLTGTAAVQSAGDLPVVSYKPIIDQNGQSLKVALLGTAGVVTFPTINTFARSASKPPVCPDDYGAICDGASHPLSERYATLAAAQVAYPFATALTQEIDYCAYKAAANVAFGADGAEHGAANKRLNRPLNLAAGGGLAYFGNDTLYIKSLDSGVIYGAGKDATVITGRGAITGSYPSGDGRVLVLDGCWYSEISNCQFKSSIAGLATFEIDKQSGAFGVQGNTLRNVTINGNNSLYAFTMCRLGGSSAQGSENLYWNIHIFNATQAGYYQTGFNALANTFFGGNIQSCSKYGIQCDFGSVHVYGVGFQSTIGYTQILNGGYDISLGGGGAFDTCEIHGCRTESLRFLNNDGTRRANVTGCVQVPATHNWQANTAVNSSTTWGAAVKVPGTASSANPGRLFVATTPGTTGATEPAWPTDGVSTVADGTVVWQELKFNYIYNGRGFTDATSGSAVGDTRTYGRVRTVTADAVIGNESEVIVDATAGNITLKLPWMGNTGTAIESERIIKIMRVDNTTNVVTVSQQVAALTSALRTLPGNSSWFFERTGAPSPFWAVTYAGYLGAAQLIGEATDTWAQRNGTAAQRLVIYKTRTDATTNEGIALDAGKTTPGVLRLMAVKGSAGGSLQLIAIDGYTKAGAMAAGDLPAGTFAVEKNSSGGEVTLGYNDATALTGVSVASGKILATANSLNLSGADGANINFGAGGTVLYSAGAALTKTDDTNVTVTLGGSPATALVNAASLTLGWTGTLAVSRGGTGGGSASGTLLDNISGFASTGMLARTASGTYAFRTIAGTSNRVSVTNGDGVAGAPTIDISASYVGQTSITTLGTVATGVWQGTKVNLAYGGTNSDLSATGAATHFLRQASAGAAVTVGAIVAADLAGLSPGFGNITSTGNLPNAVGYGVGGSAANGLYSEAGNPAMAAAGALRAYWTSTNYVLASVGVIWVTNNTYDVGAAAGNSPRTGYFATSVVTPTVNATTAHQTNGTKVLGARDTGWTAMTGTPDKASTFDVATVSLPELAARVAALQASLTTHGAIGA